MPILHSFGISPTKGVHIMINDLVYYVLSALVVLIALTVHEFSHGYAAYKLGDPTAKNMGRLSLNPIRHLDPIGALMLIFFHFGWAKPVPINARYFKKPKRDFAITALAGPMSNLILAFFSALAYLCLALLYKNAEITSEFARSLLLNVILFVQLFHLMNLGLGIFNLLPIPPFDGSRILYSVLPTEAYFAVMRHERKIYYGVLAWLLLGDILAKGLMSLPFAQGSAVIEVIASVLSGSELLGSAVNALSRLMIKFWQLIPIFRF